MRQRKVPKFTKRQVELLKDLRVAGYLYRYKDLGSSGKGMRFASLQAIKPRDLDTLLRSLTDKQVVLELIKETIDGMLMYHAKNVGGKIVLRRLR